MFPMASCFARLHGEMPTWSSGISFYAFGALRSGNRSYKTSTRCFPGSDIKVNWEPETDEFINVQIKIYDSWVPFELAGTGILQATQILSYIHRFDPSLVVLDEPDSHLHPNNQRLLCALLRRIAEERSTQIILTTHSRHVVDAVGYNSGFLWVRNGKVDSVGRDEEIGVLLDIGSSRC